MERVAKLLLEWSQAGVWTGFPAHETRETEGISLMRKYRPCGSGWDRWTRRGFPAVLALALGACAARAPAPAPEPPLAPPVAAAPAPVAPAPTPPAPVVLQPAVREEAPLVYTVQPGDTLWSISSKFLLDPWQWPEVWFVNGEIANPHKIYPGDVIKLLYVNRRPQLVRQEAPVEPAPENVEKWSPRVRSMPLDEAVPMIPIDAIRHFLRGPRLVTAEELAAAPYLLAFADEVLVGGAGTTTYVQNLRTPAPAHFDVVRRGQAYRDPDTGDLLGYEAVPVGEVEVRQAGKPSTAVLSRTSREALIGDRLLPVEPEAFSENFYPRAPAAPIDGRIIGVTDGLSQIGQYRVVALNRGTQHGLEPGHVLDILQAGRSARDPYASRRVALPEEYAGRVIVFKVTPRVSYALVMSVVRPAHTLDKVEKPVAGRR